VISNSGLWNGGQQGGIVMIRFLKNGGQELISTKIIKKAIRLRRMAFSMKK
jgi:hypothetical protein